MTIATTTDGKEYYIDGWLLEFCQRYKELINEKDRDGLLVVDGDEGTGKSVLAMQVANTVDPTFSIDRVCITYNQFVDKIKTAKKGQAVIFDEAFRGFSSRSATSKLNKFLTSLMMEVRQLNLFIIIVLPKFFSLDSYVAVDRSIGLLHVYRKGDRLGYWVYFNKVIKNSIFKYGKKFHEYKNKYIPTSKRRGRFYDQYVIDEYSYRQKKKTHFMEADMNTSLQRYKVQRDVLFKILKDEFSLTYRDIVDRLGSHGVLVGETTIFDAVKNLKD